jgi:nitrite reductase (NADH) small subunit
MSARAKTKWADIGALDAIPVRGARVVRTPTGCIAIFRTSADEVYAIDDKCPHKAGPLAQGIVHDKSVTCPLHNWVISLETGKAQGADEGRVKTYALKVEAGRMLLDVSAIVSERAA